jgi:hypothetical protein
VLIGAAALLILTRNQDLVFIRQAKKDCIFDDRSDSTGSACIHLDAGHNSALRGTTFFTGLIYRYLSMLDSLPPPNQFISIVDELAAQPDPRTTARSGHFRKCRT